MKEMMNRIRNKETRSFCSRRAGFLALLVMILLALPLQAQAASASIKLNKTSLTLTKGSTKQLKATVTGKKKTVTWKSSAPSVVSVTRTGKVTAKKAGTATITARANGKTAKCKITVKNVNYKGLYKAFLAKSKVKAGNISIVPKYFYVLNIDQSGVPELIVTESMVSPLRTYYVYTVKNGAVKYLGYCTYRGMGASPTIQYSTKYKGIYVSGWTNGVGGVWEALYGISGSKLIRKQHCEGYYSDAETFYTGTTDKKSQKVSKSKYTSFGKKYYGSLKKYKMKANTAANRAKLS